MSTKKQFRLGNKLGNLLLQVKKKNNLPSLGEAGETLADYLNNIPKKRKIKQRIIREIEF